GINYPVDQSAFKETDVGSVDIEVIDADGFIYSSPHGDFNIDNSDTYEQVKGITCTAPGDENTSSTNFRIVATRSANDTSNTFNKIVLVDDSAPSCTITIQRNKSGSYLTAPHLPIGTHSIKITSNDSLSTDPILSVDCGTIGAWSGTGATRYADLTLVVGDTQGIGTFSGLEIYNLAKKQGTIITNTTFTFDKTDPVIQSITPSISVWYPSEGQVTFTIDMGEDTTGFTGTIDLSAFNKGVQDLVAGGVNNLMTYSFTPNSADVVATAPSVTVYDKAKNSD
ncbi:unnamed protein product, partial [marine sediment metagenome]